MRTRRPPLMPASMVERASRIRLGHGLIAGARIC